MIDIQNFDIGCEPVPSGPAETLIQDGWKTYLLFHAVSKAIGPSGHLRDLGVAVLDCRDCTMTKFGYPNDEGMPEHSLYECGLADAESSVLEVMNSEWAREIEDQRYRSARRIWLGRGSSLDWTRDRKPSRHFVVLLKEKTFECLASSMTVECFYPTFAEAISFVMSKLSEH